MKNNFKSVLFIMLLALASPAYAQQARMITLKDGSVIKGEVKQLSEGVYKLKTGNLGEISVPESDVVSIVAEGAARPTPQPTPSAPNANESLKAQAQQMQSNLLSDPEIMADIQNLMQDPEMQSIFSDPAFMEAIFSYNPDSIQQNENTQTLMRNPKFQALMEKMQKKMGAGN